MNKYNINFNSYSYGKSNFKETYNYINDLSLKFKNAKKCLDAIKEKYEDCEIEIINDLFFVKPENKLHYNIKFNSNEKTYCSCSLYLKEVFNTFDVIIQPYRGSYFCFDRLFVVDSNSFEVFINNYSYLKISEENIKEIDLFIKNKCSEHFLKHKNINFTKASYQSPFIKEWLETTKIFE